MEVADEEGKGKLTAGAKALKRIKTGYKKLWADWTGEGSVGVAVMVASDEALRTSGAEERQGGAYSRAFSALLEQYGLGEEDGLDKQTRAALLNLMPVLAEVNDWLWFQEDHDALNHPRTVWPPPQPGLAPVMIVRPSSRHCGVRMSALSAK